MHRNYSPSPSDPGAASLDESRGERLEALEAIRGLAALTVVFWHLVLAFFPYALTRNHGFPALDALIRSPLAIVIDGTFAVRIFFVLSGVVLSLAFFRHPSNEALSSAAIRRYFRLAPPVVFSIVVAYALFKLGVFFNRPVAAAFGPPGEWLSVWYGFEPRLLDALYEGFTCLATFGYRIQHTYNPVVWTMPVEMYGSLLVFATLALVGHFRRRAWIYFVLGGILSSSGSNYLSFIVGIALCDAYVADRRRLRPRELGAIAGTILILAGLGLAALRSGWFDGTAAWFVKTYHSHLQTVGAAITIATVLFCPFWRRVLERRSLAALGRYSFSLYLLHLPILCSLGCYSFLLAGALGCSIVAAGLIASGVVIVATWIAAHYCHAWIDRPSIALAKRIEKLFRPAEPATAGEPCTAAAR